MRLRVLLLVAPLLAAGAASLFAACGGSASETPWPAEPEVQVPGPAGESMPPPDGLDARDRDDAGPPRKQP